jgi:hypothetical protein
VAALRSWAAPWCLAASPEQAKAVLVLGAFVLAQRYDLGSTEFNLSRALIFYWS